MRYLYLIFFVFLLLCCTNCLPSYEAIQGIGILALVCCVFISICILLSKYDGIIAKYLMVIFNFIFQVTPDFPEDTLSNTETLTSENARKEARFLQLELQERLQKGYRILACSRCQENTFLLLSVSPNCRSIHVSCLNCKKKSHAKIQPHSTYNSHNSWKDFQRIVNKHGLFFSDITRIIVKTSSLETKYTRSTIPKDIRAEVWDRDNGKCVECDSKENLQFDHIIPVSKGGANSVENIQILCQTCNLSKSNKI